MSYDFEYDFEPREIPGVLDIQTLGVSPYLLEQLTTEDARNVLLATSKALQVAAHPDHGNADWVGPDVRAITYAASVVKQMPADALQKALDTFITKEAQLRQSAYDVLQHERDAAAARNTQLGEAVVSLLAGSQDTYRHTNGTVISHAIWTDNMTETLYMLDVKDGTVANAQRIEREAALLESLPKAYQKPLAEANELAGSLDADVRVIVVANDGTVQLAPNRYDRNQRTMTDIVLPLDPDYDLRGSYIHFRDAKSKKNPKKVKLGMHMFAREGAVEDDSVTQLIDASYVGVYRPDLPNASPKSPYYAQLQRIVKSQDLAQNLPFETAIGTDTDLAALIANGFISLKRGDSRFAGAGMVYRTTHARKAVAFLPPEMLTISQ